MGARGPALRSESQESELAWPGGDSQHPGASLERKADGGIQLVAETGEVDLGEFRVQFSAE